MITTDPIADMLTRIRNAIMSEKAEVVIPYSKMKHSIAELLKQSGYVEAVVEDREQSFAQLVIKLNGDNVRRPITKLSRLSKPGRRIYAKFSEIPVVLNGKGMVIISTPAGLMTGNQARKQGLGGELVCEVY